MNGFIIYYKNGFYKVKPGITIDSFLIENCGYGRYSRYASFKECAEYYNKKNERNS